MNGAVKPAKDWTITYTGRRFPVLYPTPEDIDVRDIAHANAMRCRYTGHCIKFYSVAEHSWLLWDYATVKNMPWEHRAWALMHDGPEYILQDLMRPVKKQVPAYRDIEGHYEEIFADKFGLPFPIPTEVMELDTAILLDERAQNTAAYKSGNPFEPAGYEMCEEERDGWPTCEPLNVTLRLWTPEQAETAFLSAFYSTMSERP